MCRAWSAVDADRDRMLGDKVGYAEDDPVRLSIAKRLAEAEELLPRIQP
jgi:hypothetical protein